MYCHSHMYVCMYVWHYAIVNYINIFLVRFLSTQCLCRHHAHAHFIFIRTATWLGTWQSSVTRTWTTHPNYRAWIFYYCHSHNNWGPRNSFQRFLVPIYYWRTVEKPETDPSIIMGMAVHEYFSLLSGKELHILTTEPAYFITSIFYCTFGPPNVCRLSVNVPYCHSNNNTFNKLSKITDASCHDFNGLPVVNWY
jgi:hypothetical protein